ncbi:GNAT family N-acetyltransferase [Anaeromicropila herbilytica]|uniref:Putative N-acetyltransferase YnaD n=1 Tax=Anaeromicropila herbilytica TaxID=2785025 RepID=A0A7R7EHL7_9FIRM|nr:GNAT family N-acetyltransferase [Anaeromicropila herbilytica]BCN29006.1 putative N-acetyltransferase YnaD [Anaeromicropila herbilytica]
MNIETNNLIIRNFAEQDIDALYNIKYDKQVMEFIPTYLERSVTKEKINDYIKNFNLYEAKEDFKSKRKYAIQNKKTNKVMGSISFGMNELLHEYELGWQMMEQYRKKGYASEAAITFSEYFCEKNNVDYLIAVMDVDNPPSYRTALKSGFKLFEKRTVYDYTYNRYCDDYYYFRRYYSKTSLSNQFYGDTVYDGRHS